MIGVLLAFFGASLWALPAAVGAASFVVSWIFGGDWQSALIAGSAIGGALLAYKLLPEGLGKPVAGAVLAIGALLFAFRRGERRGAAARERDVAKETERLIRKGQNAAREADEHNADPRNINEDDGWRRD